MVVDRTGPRHTVCVRTTFGNFTLNLTRSFGYSKKWILRVCSVTRTCSGIYLECKAKRWESGCSNADSEVNVATSTNTHGYGYDKNVEE